MKNNAKSVIYCRVSSQAQVRKGDGLGSQETRCREYARMHRYDVEAVFYDEGISGSLLDRPKMREMLDYLTKHSKKEPYVVVIDDISRLARDLETHIKLRTAINHAGGKLESPTIEFGEDSDSRLVEHLLASVAAHQREKNAEQVKNRMRARMQNGYWVFKAPAGYKFDRKPGHGKILVPDEPAASVVRQALEGFASGRFESQSEVMHFLISRPEFPRDRGGKTVHYTRVTELLERVIYTGYMEYKEWGIPLMQAKHEPLISYDTFVKIQDRMHERAKAPMRADINLDFPLRGFVLCASCGKAVTACWSAGRSSRHPYYICRNPECPECKKSIKRDQIEKEFEGILRDMTPSPDLVAVIRTAVKGIWNERYADHSQYIEGIQTQIRGIERRIEQFLDRIVESDSTTLIRTYETKVTQLEGEKASLAGKLVETSQAPLDFDSCFQTAFDFIGNPHKMWAFGDFEDKRLVLKLAFARQLPYRRNEGFQTAALALPFEVLRGFREGKSGMVEHSGVEPLTSCMPCKRSTS